jgi:hypothetical protein
MNRSPELFHEYLQNANAIPEMMRRWLFGPRNLPKGQDARDAITIAGDS